MLARFLADHNFFDDAGSHLHDRFFGRLVYLDRLLLERGDVASTEGLVDLAALHIDVLFAKSDILAGRCFDDARIDSHTAALYITFPDGATGGAAPITWAR